MVQAFLKKWRVESEWDYINSTINEGVQLVTNSKEKAEILIRQFQSVFTKDTLVNMPNTTKQVRNLTPTLTIREKGVADLFKKVNPSKASGPDNIYQIESSIAPIFTTMY